MPTPEQKLDEKVTRLTDVEVREVSLVDKGANQRTLLVVKNAGENMPADAFEQAVADAQSGAPSTDDLDARDDGSLIEQADEDVTGEEKSEEDAIVDAQADKASGDTDLIVGMDEQTRAAMSEAMKAIETRIGALRTAVDAAKSDATAQTSPKLVTEIVEVAQALGRLAHTEKSEPVRVEQMQMMADGTLQVPVELAMPMYLEFARTTLYDAIDSLYGPSADVTKACGMIGKVLQTLVPLTGGVEMAEAVKQYAFNPPQPSIPAGVPNDKLPEGVSKAGRKMSGDRLARLEQALATLQALAAELDPAKVSKSDDDAVARLAAQNAELMALAKAQDAELKQLRAARPAGNASAQGEHETDTPARSRVTWPDDLNAKDDPDLRF